MFAANIDILNALLVLEISCKTIKLTNDSKERQKKNNAIRDLSVRKMCMGTGLWILVYVAFFGISDPFILFFFLFNSSRLFFTRADVNKGSNETQERDDDANKVQYSSIGLDSSIYDYIADVFVCDIRFFKGKFDPNQIYSNRAPSTCFEKSSYANWNSIKIDRRHSKLH